MWYYIQYFTYYNFGRMFYNNVVQVDVLQTKYLAPIRPPTVRLR